jgi:murein DD-endopeptidase MepM/ murein hydrolase activator NlpD
LINKFTYTLALVAAFIFFSAADSYAFKVELRPAEVIPGDVFLVTVQTESTDNVSAKFLKKQIVFSSFEENTFIALVPVDINTAPDTYLLRVQQGEEEQSVYIRVRSHEFETIKLTLPEGKVTLSPENQKRAEREYLLLKKIWPKASELSWKGRFTVPLDTEISTVFGVKRIMNEKKTSVHRGTDFRGKTGTPVRAINSGTVVLSEDLFYGGNTLIVDHGMGLYSVYMHLSEFIVSKNDAVLKKQVIGFVGSSGRVTGPHLHLSVKLNGVSVNPGSLFDLDL